MKQDINQKEPSGSVQQQEPAGTRTADTKKEPVQASRPRRKMKSGPHIYGQEDGGINAQEYGRQGTVRRTVQGDPSGESRGIRHRASRHVREARRRDSRRAREIRRREDLCVREARYRASPCGREARWRDSRRVRAVRSREWQEGR